MEKEISDPISRTNKNSRDEIHRWYRMVLGYSDELVVYLLNYSNLPLLIVAVVDLVFAALFVEFFVNYKKLDPTDIVLAYPVRKEQ